MKSLKILFLAVLFCCSNFIHAQTNADQLLGLWEPSSGKARVKIEKLNNKYFGRIVWLKEPIDPTTKLAKLDKNNPEVSLQKNKLIGIKLLNDFIYKDEEWTDGTIYDPENGSTYSCVITAKDINTLNIRGYIGVKMFGRSDTWKRLQVKK